MFLVLSDLSEEDRTLAENYREKLIAEGSFLATSRERLNVYLPTILNGYLSKDEFSKWMADRHYSMVVNPEEQVDDIRLADLTSDVTARVIHNLFNYSVLKSAKSIKQELQESKNI